MYKKRHSVLWILSSILEFRIQACFMLANTPSWETELQIYGIARVIGGMSRIITITRHLAQRFLLHWFASIISIQSSCEYSLLKDPNSSLIKISEQSCGRPPLFPKFFLSNCTFQPLLCVFLRPGSTDKLNHDTCFSWRPQWWLNGCNTLRSLPGSSDASISIPAPPKSVTTLPSFE
jgi:hypothetical protein